MLKRLADLVFASVGLVVLLPVFAVIAAWIRLEDRGPVLFRQQRIGWKGKPFQILKFRTMVAGADQVGPALTAARDARITRAGKWLRKTKIEELPQLVNVLRGEMSLVGPRPEVPRYVDRYTPEQRKVLELKPGITDPASIKYRKEEELLSAVADSERFYIDKLLKDKIRINLDYASQASFLTDLRTILQTLRIWPSP